LASGIIAVAGWDAEKIGATERKSFYVSNITGNGQGTNARNPRGRRHLPGQPTDTGTCQKTRILPAAKKISMICPASQ